MSPLMRLLLAVRDPEDCRVPDQTVVLEGNGYVWSHSVKEGSYTWRTEDYTQPPTAVVAGLNRYFVEKHAATVVSELEPAQRSFFADVLTTMGATYKQIKEAGLEKELETNDPEYLEAKSLQEMPPAGHTPFNNPVLRDWFIGVTPSVPFNCGLITVIGESPFDRDSFTCFLLNSGFTCEEPSDRTEAVILGRSGWDEEEINDLIDSRTGHCLKFYSQEMFLAYLAKREDPFWGGDQVLAAFRAGHAGLEFVSQGWSGWVQTFIPRNRRSHSARSNTDFGVEESPLKLMGYSVGAQGEDDLTRQGILEQAFLEQIPIAGTRDYMAQWGEPRSPARLKKIADLLSTLCREGKKRSNPPTLAIDDWESDLNWLCGNFYHGHMQFSWPSTHVW